MFKLRESFLETSDLQKALKSDVNKSNGWEEPLLHRSLVVPRERGASWLKWLIDGNSPEEGVYCRTTVEKNAGNDMSTAVLGRWKTASSCSLKCVTTLKWPFRRRWRRRSYTVDYLVTQAVKTLTARELKQLGNINRVSFLAAKFVHERDLNWAVLCSALKVIQWYGDVWLWKLTIAEKTAKETLEKKQLLFLEKNHVSRSKLVLITSRAFCESV